MKLAIVTGGSSGLGRAFCMQLARQGDWHVTIADIDEAGARETLSQMAALQGTSQGEFVRLDVTDREGWNRLREHLRLTWPHLHLLVNNAGICASGEVGNSDHECWRRVLEVNFFGALWGCDSLVGWLRESAAHKPVLINVASIAATMSAPAMGAYSAAKAALVSLSETLYSEVQGADVQVRVVAPGFFVTHLLEKGSFADARHLAKAQQLARESRFTADDVARAALAPSRRLYVVVGRRARLIASWKRLAPQSLLRFLARRYRKVMIVNEQTP